MQFTVSVKRSGNRNHFMPEQLVYRRIGTGSWGRNECVTNEPQRTSAWRLQQQQQQFISVSSGSLFMYAEDTSIFCIGQSADSAIALLNKAL